MAEKERGLQNRKTRKKKVGEKKHLKIVYECLANFYARPDILHLEEGFESQKCINRA